MNPIKWREGLIRGIRTFFQTLGGAVIALEVSDLTSKSVAISIGMKLLSALIASALAGLAAFATNIGGTSP